MIPETRNQKERLTKMKANLIANDSQIKIYTLVAAGWKPALIAKDQESAWCKPGNILIELPVGAISPTDNNGMATGRDKIVTAQVGAEWPQGTVKGKRLIIRDGGKIAQYQVKPRGAAAEKRHQMTVRLQKMESDLHINADYLTPEKAAEMHAEITELRAKLVK